MDFHGAARINAIKKRLKVLIRVNPRKSVAKNFDFASVVNLVLTFQLPA